MIRKLLAFIILVVIVSSCTKQEEVIDYGPIDKKIIEDYLKAHNLTAQSTASGLYYSIENPGNTTFRPQYNSSVMANYRGSLLANGTVFDETYSKGKPSTFSLLKVIEGWQEGLQLIGIKGKIKLFVPSTLGYGSKPVIDNTTLITRIPANSVLIFEVELLEIYY